MAAVSLVSEATLGEWPQRRFRPNIVLSGGGEDDLVGRRVAIGDARLDVTARLGRCVMVTRPQPGSAEQELGREGSRRAADHPPRARRQAGDRRADRGRWTGLGRRRAAGLTVCGTDSLLRPVRSLKAIGRTDMATGSADGVRRKSLRRALATVRESIATELWPIPTAAIVVGVALGIVLPLVDRAVDSELPPLLAGLLFAGGVDSARAVLSAISGSLITATSLTFSLTVIALQLASSQVSPRILRTFSKDQTVHATLGTLRRHLRLRADRVAHRAGWHRHQRPAGAAHRRHPGLGADDHERGDAHPVPRAPCPPAARRDDDAAGARRDVPHHFAHRRDAGRGAGASARRLPAVAGAAEPRQPLGVHPRDRSLRSS